MLVKKFLNLVFVAINSFLEFLFLKKLLCLVGNIFPFFCCWSILSLKKKPWSFLMNWFTFWNRSFDWYAKAASIRFSAVSWSNYACAILFIYTLNFLSCIKCFLIINPTLQMKNFKLNIVIILRVIYWHIFISASNTNTFWKTLNITQ